MYFPRSIIPFHGKGIASISCNSSRCKHYGFVIYRHIKLDSELRTRSFKNCHFSINDISKNLIITLLVCIDTHCSLYIINEHRLFKLDILDTHTRIVVWLILRMMQFIL